MEAQNAFVQKVTSEALKNLVYGFMKFLPPTPSTRGGVRLVKEYYG